MNNIQEREKNTNNNILYNELNRKLSFGKNKIKPIIKINDNIKFTILVNIKPLNINSPLFLDFGKYLKKELLNPKRDNNVIKPMIDITVVAKPISVELKFLAATTQKINPKRLIKIEFSIR